MSINIDGRDCCQTGQFSQDVADGALTKERNIQVCATLNGIVKIIKAQNLSFFVTGSFKPSGLFPPAPQK
ncbi:hypothetical protein P4G41_24655 (plasmid) [Shigella boydii]|nr:hypothetical protein [Shigella boydii]